MRKTVAVLAALGLALSGVTSSLALDQALAQTKKITVANVLSSTVHSPTLTQLSGKRTLVSWVEDKEGRISLRAKIISASNKVSKVQTLYSSTADIQSNANTYPQIASNKKGKLFAAWVSRSLSNGVVFERVVGRTSTNGYAWSKPFFVSDSLRVSTDMCMNSNSPGCGYSSLQIAVDDTGRVGVLLADIPAEGIVNYSAAVTSNPNKWPLVKLVGKVSSQRRSEIVGLFSGFAVSYTDYSSFMSCDTKVAIFDGKSSKWGSTITAQSIKSNTVVYSKWLQRDGRTLSLVMSSELQAGGIAVRNYSISKKNWSGASLLAKSSEPNVVFQNFTAAATATSLTIGYNTYNQLTGETQIRMLIQNKPNTSFKATTVQIGGEIEPLLSGFNKAKSAILIFDEDQVETRIASAKSGLLVRGLPGTSEISGLVDASIASTNIVSMLYVSRFETSSTLTLIRGMLK